MKQTLTLLAALFITIFSFAFSTPADKSPMNANNIMMPLAFTGKTISLNEFSKLTPGKYHELTGIKMGFFERIAFKKATKHLRNSIDENGNIKSTKVTKALMANDVGGFFSDFHIGGFALGLFLGPIGVLIAYLLSSGPVKSRRKWAWIGLIFCLLLFGFWIL